MYSLLDFSFSSWEKSKKLFLRLQILGYCGIIGYTFEELVSNIYEANTLLF